MKKLSFLILATLIFSFFSILSFAAISSPSAPSYCPTNGHEMICEFPNTAGFCDCYAKAMVCGCYNDGRGGWCTAQNIAHAVTVLIKQMGVTQGLNMACASADDKAVCEEDLTYFLAITNPDHVGCGYGNG
jgi:hypothetical protein